MGYFLDVTQHLATGDLKFEQRMACGLQASEAVFLLERDVLSERSWTVTHSAQGTSRGFAQPEVWQGNQELKAVTSTVKVSM